jgi:hypothetical protein
MLFDPYRQLLDEAQLQVANDRRSTTVTERRRSIEAASLSGLLLDVAESQLDVGVQLDSHAGAAWRRGTIRHVSEEFIVLRTASTDFHAIRRGAIACVSLRDSGQGDFPTGERTVEQATMQEILFIAADLRLNANLHIGSDRWVTGVIQACGQDICTVRGGEDRVSRPSPERFSEGIRSALMYVAIDAVQEVVLADA